MVHGPDVEAITGKDIHERVLAARNGKIVARKRRQRGAVDQEQNRKWRGGGRGFAEALSEHVELHVSLLGPIVMAPDIGRFRRGGLCGREAGDQTGAKTEPRAGEEGASCQGSWCGAMVVHGALPMGLKCRHIMWRLIE